MWMEYGGPNYKILLYILHGKVEYCYNTQNIIMIWICFQVEANFYLIEIKMMCPPKILKVFLEYETVDKLRSISTYLFVNLPWNCVLK